MITSANSLYCHKSSVSVVLNPLFSVCKLHSVRSVLCPVSNVYSVIETVLGSNAYYLISNALAGWKAYHHSHATIAEQIDEDIYGLRFS
jgi:hypothetical protein